MTVTIVAIGTRGDVEAFLILGRELRRRGHRVLMGTSSFYSSYVQASQLEWVQIGSGTREQMQTVLRSFSSCRDIKDRPRAYFLNWIQPQLNESTDAIRKAAMVSDFFISNTKMCVWKDDLVMPGAFVTYDVPNSLNDLANHGSHLSNGRIIELVAMNKRLVDPTDTWSEAFQFTGFWLEPSPVAWRPPDELVDFLSCGPPPVAITMGSMLPAGSELLAIMMESLRLAGQRGILLGNWPGVGDGKPTTDNICFASEVLYHWLFPRASGVIHHGGIGTVAAALSAGVPSIVLPQIPSQQRIADVLTREGLAAGVFDSQTLQPRELASAIQRAVADEGYAQKSRVWHEELHRDRGILAAVDLIEQHWNSLRQGVSVKIARPGISSPIARR